MANSAIQQQRGLTAKDTVAQEGDESHSLASLRQGGPPLHVDTVLQLWPTTRHTRDPFQSILFGVGMSAYIIHVHGCTGTHARVWICVEVKDVISQGPFTLCCETGSLTKT